MLVFSGFNITETDAMVDLVRKTFHKEYSRDLFLEMGTLFPEEFITVMDEEGLAGFLMGALTSPKEVRVLILVVDEKYRGNGIGSDMLTEFIEKSRAKGLKRIRLEVKTANENAISLYKRFGFRMDSTLKHYYGDGGDGYLMYLEI